MNRSKPHLKKGGTRILFNNLAESVSNVLQWQYVLHSFTNGLCDTKKADKYNAKPSNDSGLVQNLQIIRRSNINRCAIAHLNINSLRNKQVDKITGNDEILMISETKLGNRFTVGQFMIKGYSLPFRPDRDSQGGGISKNLQQKAFMLKST